MTIINGLLDVDKGKYIRAHASHAFRTSRYVTTLILNIITRWRWATDFTFWPIYHRKKASLPNEFGYRWSSEMVCTF